MADKKVNKMNERICSWELKLREHREKQLINPFSEWEGASHRAKLSPEDDNYGRPVTGSGTELRGKQANEHVSAEIIKLLEIIQEYGTNDNENNLLCIRFGFLFELYTRISNKVVGILIRARRYGLIDFKGEMLFQGRDENVIIWLTERGKEISQQ